MIYYHEGNVKLRVNFKKYNQTIISRILSNLVQKAKNNQKTIKKQYIFIKNNKAPPSAAPPGRCRALGLLF